MKTIYHAMITFMAAKGKMTERELAAVCFPDAVRAYTGCRQLSHFEEGLTGTSWMTFPMFMWDKYIPTEGVGCHDAGALNIDGALGGKTDLQSFKAHNQNLPFWMYRNIEIHLVQDMIFDEFIRDHFGESEKAADKYYSRWYDKYLTAKELRQQLSEFEDELYPLIQDTAKKMLNKRLPFDDFKEKLADAFDRNYPDELRGRTLSYMTMDNEIKKKTDDLKYERKEDLVFCYRYQAVAMINKMIQETRKILKF